MAGTTLVPSAHAISAPGRSRAVLRAWRGAGFRAANSPSPAAGGQNVQTPSAPHLQSLRGGGDGTNSQKFCNVALCSKCARALTFENLRQDKIHSHRFELRDGAFFESRTRQEGDVVKARFSVDGAGVSALTLHWVLSLFLSLSLSPLSLSLRVYVCYVCVCSLCVCVCVYCVCVCNCF